MAALSQRLVCLALLASASSLLGVRPAFAQVPIFQAVGASEPSAPAPPAAPAAVSPAPAAPTEALLPAPAPPSGAATSTPPGTQPAAAPADGLAPTPARSAVIIEPSARRAAEAPSDQDVDDDGTNDDRLRRRRWYGWQTLTADGASLTALLLGAGLSSLDSNGNGAATPLAWAGLLGYEFAPGVVHFAHHNVGRGFASFGLRLGMPLAGAFVGASLASDCNDNLCEAGGAAIGALLGMGGAIAIDAALFAFDDAKRSARRRILPLAVVTPERAWIGLGGEL